MGKLLQRLRDPARSGVYRTPHADPILEALAGEDILLARVDLRAPVFDAFSAALGFPSWFGRNWDALEDCLTDLSWREAPGYLLLLEGGAGLKDQERGLLVDVLGAAARFWASQGTPFFAVFVDPGDVLGLERLFRA